MAKKKNKFNKTIIILSVVFALILIAVTAITYFIYAGKPVNSHGGQAIFEISSPVSGEAQSGLSDAEYYKPYKAIETERNKEVPLSAVFGTAYSGVGGSLVLNKDGTFILYAGLSNKDEDEGTYLKNNDSVSLTFSDGTTEELPVSVNENGNEEVVIRYGLYSVYFEKKG